MADFRQLQKTFTAHLRAPLRHPPPPGIEERRLKIYRELFYNNVDGFLANAFPVLRRITADAHWQPLVRDFYARHESHSPLLHGLAAEFLAYLEHERGAVEGDWPFLQELAHYEWVELALSVAEDVSLAHDVVADGDLLDGVPVLSPLAWPLAYDFPVHRIGPELLPDAPTAQQTLLLVWRDHDDAVRFMELNALTARLLELLDSDAAATGRALLLRIAQEAAHPDPAQLLAQGAELLRNLRARGVLLGAKAVAAGADVGGVAAGSRS